MELSVARTGSGWSEIVFAKCQGSSYWANYKHLADLTQTVGQEITPKLDEPQALRL